MEQQLRASTKTGLGLRRKLTLERMGVWTIGFFVIYFLLITSIIAFERREMLGAVGKLQDVHGSEERLVALNINVSRTILAINENYFSPDLEGAAKILVLEVEAILPGLKRLQVGYPILDADIAAIQQAVEDLKVRPTREIIAELRTIVHRLVIELDVVTEDVHAQKERTVERYQSTFNRVMLEWLFFGVVGLALIAAIILTFFRNLARDVKRVQDRASAIVRGYRAEPLAHQRSDELGELMDAVNRMQLELRERESQIEIVRQQQFHKEKMAAVGSLAASVAHEINNPLAAIVGVAQTIDEACQSDKCSRRGEICHPSMILDQARRVMQITRRISEFSVPQSQEPSLLDVNSLLRSTCNFVGFDQRFRLIDLETELDSNLPAIEAVADHLVQVAMNLLINAADALKDRTEPPPRIVVRTSLSDDGVIIEVVDNGSGIAPDVIDLVFNEYFSTKGPGRGSGLGLAVCRSLIRDAGGDITIKSALNSGTTVRINLPLLQESTGSPGEVRIGE